MDRINKTVNGSRAYDYEKGMARVKNRDLLCYNLGCLKYDPERNRAHSVNEIMDELNMSLVTNVTKKKVKPLS